jgi:hypothetical protein
MTVPEVFDKAEDALCNQERIMAKLGLPAPVMVPARVLPGDMVWLGHLLGWQVSGDEDGGVWLHCPRCRERYTDMPPFEVPRLAYGYLATAVVGALTHQCGKPYWGAGAELPKPTQASPTGYLRHLDAVMHQSAATGSPGAHEARVAELRAAGLSEESAATMALDEDAPYTILEKEN